MSTPAPANFSPDDITSQIDRQALEDVVMRIADVLCRRGLEQLARELLRELERNGIRMEVYP